MNRFLSALPLLGALAGTAAAAPYVLPSKQYGTLTPYDWQPTYAIEGLYSFAQHNHLPDSGGLRGSLNLYNSGEGTFRHQFNLNVAAAWGNDTVNLAHFIPSARDWLTLPHTELKLFLLPVTLGYNLNIELWDNILLYLGGKAGAAWGHAKLKLTGLTEDGLDYTHSRSKSTGGFTFSIGGGLKVQCSEHIYAHAGYEFGRSYLNFNREGRDSLIYGTHTIYLGLSHVF